MSLDLLHLVQQARAEFAAPLLTADEVAHCLYRAAQLAQDEGHDVGVLLKPGGSGGMSPIGRISLDILIDIPDQQEYDCFGSADGEHGAPGPANPMWDKKPYKVGKCAIVDGVETCSGASMDRVRRPLGAPVPTPNPQPPTQPPSQPSPALIDLDALADRIAAKVVAQLELKIDLALGAAEDATAAAERAERAAKAERVIELRIPYLGLASGVIKAPK